MTPSKPADSTPKTEPFPSFDAMRAAHSQLLKQFSIDAVADETNFVQTALDFIVRAQATGAMLDGEDERDGAQTMLDYWSSRLYRMGRAAPEVILDEFNSELAPEIPDALCPYRGLSSFREDDAAIFFGRKKTLDELLARLKESRWLSVTGPSGSGKSSVVRAGLLPLLKSGAIDGSDQWIYLPIFVPGSDPLRNLLIAIEKAEKGEVANEAEIEEHDHSAEIDALIKDTQGLLKLLESRLGKNIVIVIDQFEEIFTLCDNESIRRTFVENLLTIVRSEAAGHRVILTIRMDFEQKLAIYPELQEIVEANMVRLTPLTASDLREAIEEPARKIGLKFEDGLIDSLLNDILGEPAALPLLQFTLLKLWENRDRNRITWEDYRKLGGGRQALARSADEFYNNLIPEDQVTAKRILLRLVRPGEGLELTSQRMRRVDLYSRSDAVDRIDRVLQKFIDARLLRQTKGGKAFDDQIEVAHEALVRNWPTLVGWLEDEREAIRQRRRLTIAAERWNELGCSPDLVLRGVELEEALRYDDLNEMENNFIKASQQERADEIEKAKQVADELRKRNRIISIASVVAGVVAVIAIFLGLFALNRSIEATSAREDAEVALITARAANQEANAQASTAEAERLRAEDQRQAAETAEEIALQERNAAQTANAQIVTQQAIERVQSTAIAVQETAAAEAQQIASASGRLALGRQLADQARSLVSRQTDLGLLLALESAKLGESLAGKGVLLDVLRANPRLKQYLHDHEGAVNAVVYRPDGKFLGSAGSDLNVVICSTEGDSEPVILPSGGKIGINALSFGPKNDLLAAGTCNELDRSGTCSGGLLVFWDLASGTYETTTMQIHRDAITALQFDPTGTLIATGDGDGVVQIWSVPPKGSGLWQAEPRGSYTGQNGAIRDMAYTRRGAVLITASEDGTIYVRDVNQRQVLVRLDHKGPVNAIAVTPDGRYLASGVGDASIFIYDLNNYQRVAGPLSQHTSSITGLDFSPDGQTLVSSSEDGTLVIWDLSELVKNGKLSAAPPSQTLQGHTDAVLTVAFSPSGKTLASGGRGAAVIEWYAQAPYPLATRFIQSTEMVLGLGFNLNGDQLLVARTNRTITRWDLTTGLASDGAQWAQIDAPQRFTSAIGPIFFVPESPDGSVLGLQFNRIAATEVLGVDANAFSGVVNWTEVQQANYRFVFVKATQGQSVVDRTFSENWAALKAVGLIRGAYHVFKPSEDPVAQAEFFVKTVSFEPGDLPPAIDVEMDDGLPGSEVLNSLQIFLLKVEELTQRKPIIFTIPYFWESLFSGKSFTQQLIPVTGGGEGSSIFNPGDYPLWFANYTKSDQPVLPISWGTWLFWQFTDQGIVPGFEDDVNVSRFNGNLQALESLANNERLVAADPGIESTTLVDLSDQVQVGAVLPLLNPTSAAVSLERNLLAVGAANGSITFWDLEQGRQTDLVLAYGNASIDSLAFSPDGSRLAAGTAEGNVVVWDLTDPATLPKLLTGHISRITSLAYGGKGQVIASGSADGSIFLWDLTGNDAVGQPLAGPNASVAALAIDAREDLLAVGFADGSILIWNINPEAWQQRACERAGRNMTEAEWEKYLQGVPYSVTCP